MLVFNLLIIVLSAKTLRHLIILVLSHLLLHHIVIFRFSFVHVIVRSCHTCFETAIFIALFNTDMASIFICIRVNYLLLLQFLDSCLLVKCMQVSFLWIDLPCKPGSFLGEESMMNAVNLGLTTDKNNFINDILHARSLHMIIVLYFAKSIVTEAAPTAAIVIWKHMKVRMSFHICISKSIFHTFHYLI